MTFGMCPARILSIASGILLEVLRGFPQATQQTTGTMSPIRLQQPRSKHFQIHCLRLIPASKVESSVVETYRPI